VEDIDLPELTSIDLPDKNHFKIGEVAKLLDLEPYVLRYWEKEFEVLSPSKTESGQRSYQQGDIKLLATIQKLLYTEMFTIDGARRQLERASQGKSSYLTRSTTDQAASAEAEGADPQALEELQWENEQLRLELEEKTSTRSEEREQLESRIAELEGQLEEAQARQGDGEEVAALTEEVETLRAANEQLRAEIEQLEEQIEESERRREELRDQQQSADQEVVQALRGQVQELADLGNSS
jgi:DNA-binding transcriptional MerR regulator